MSVGYSDDMSKQKPTTANPDRHKNKRRQIAFPAEWADVADAVATHHRQQTSWYLIGLLIEAAKPIGVPLPPAPWEKKARVKKQK